MRAGREAQPGPARPPGFGRDPKLAQRLTGLSPGLQAPPRAPPEGHAVHPAPAISALLPSWRGGAGERVAWRGTVSGAAGRLGRPDFGGSGAARPPQLQSASPSRLFPRVCRNPSTPAGVPAKGSNNSPLRPEAAPHGSDLTLGLLGSQHRSGTARDWRGGSPHAQFLLQQVRGSATPTPALRALGGSRGPGHSHHLGAHLPTRDEAVAPVFGPGLDRAGQAAVLT